MFGFNEINSSLSVVFWFFLISFAYVQTENKAFSELQGTKPLSNNDFDL